jgi:tRNA threonylcarbamoyladenosine biosynthesis protein TsaB
MLILGIETSNGKCSVALSLDGQILYSIYNSENSKQAEHLIVIIQEVLKKVSRGFSEIDYIASSTGPGSFTGIRIGLAGAKGLALALDKKVIGVNNFETIFYRIEQQVKKADHKLAIINAYRNELYICQKIGDEIYPAELISKENLSHYCSQDNKLVIAGNGAIEATFPGVDILPRFPIPDARFICKVAHQKILAGQWDEAVPLYIRQPDAKTPVLD